jgi:LysM repeat protein
MSTITISPWSAETRPARVIVRQRPQKKSAAVRLTRRGRAVVITAFLAVLAVLMIGFGGVATGAFHDGTPTPVRVIEVHPGDTLYGIAGEVAKPGHIRDMVEQIEQLNSLSSPVLQVGQKIAVPTTK